MQEIKGSTILWIVIVKKKFCPCTKYKDNKLILRSEVSL